MSEQLNAIQKMLKSEQQCRSIGSTAEIRSRRNESLWRTHAGTEMNWPKHTSRAVSELAEALWKSGMMEEKILAVKILLGW